MRRKIIFSIPNLILASGFCINMVGCSPTITYKKLDIVSFQPFYKDPIRTTVEAWKLPEGITKYNDLVCEAAKSLDNNIDSIAYKEYSQNEVLNKDLLSNMGPNQIILFEGHGSFVPFYEHEPSMHSVIWTGRQYDPKEVSEEDKINYNIIEEPISRMEVLTMNFIENYVNDLTGSIVYLGNCFSGRECTLAQTFMSKGAAVVIGNSDTTQTAYNDLMEYTTIKKLGEINQDTHLPYTIYEALEFAKGIYGRNDNEKSGFGSGSEPILYGDPNYRIAKIG